MSDRAGALIRVISRISIIGISIGMLSLVLVMSVMSGFNVNIRDRLLDLKPHLTVEINNSQKASELVTSLKKRSDLEVSLVRQQDVVVKTIDGMFSGAIAKGIKTKDFHEFLKRVEARNSRKGFSINGITLESADLKPGEVAVGMGLARDLNLYEGDQIVFISPDSLIRAAGEIPIYQNVTVRSIVETEIPEIDSKFMFYNLDKGLPRLGRAKSLETSLELRLQDPEKYKLLKKEIEPLGYTVRSWKQDNEALFYALKLEKFAMGTFIGLSTLITCFSIVTVLILLITQKRKEIGVLMAMGLSESYVKKLFTGIGVYLSAFGVFSGLTLGVALSYFLKGRKLDILPNIYYDTTIPIDIDFSLIMVASILVLVIGVFSSYFPVLLQIRNYKPAALLRVSKK